MKTVFLAIAGFAVGIFSLIAIAVVCSSYSKIIFVKSDWNIKGTPFSYSLGSKSITINGVINGVPNTAGTSEEHLDNGDVAISDATGNPKVFRNVGRVALKVKNRTYVVDLNTGEVFGSSPSY